MQLGKDYQGLLLCHSKPCGGHVTPAQPTGHAHLELGKLGRWLRDGINITPAEIPGNTAGYFLLSILFSLISEAVISFQ